VAWCYFSPLIPALLPGGEKEVFPSPHRGEGLGVRGREWHQTNFPLEVRNEARTKYGLINLPIGGKINTRKNLMLK
jgi:hypothetical protein